MGVVSTIVGGVASKILRALCTQYYYVTPFQEILNPPLIIPLFWQYYQSL
jgi:hypothetical protein